MQLRVCYFGSYRQSYSRNRIMIEGLRRNGVDVQECHQQLWQGIEDRVWVASGNFWRPSFIWRVASVYWRLILGYFSLAPYDVLIVGYPGHLDVWLARALSWLSGKPLVMDVFMSPYLVAVERGLAQQHRLTGRLLRWFEWLVYRLPDLLIQDTSEYVAWFHTHFGVDSARFRLVPTGADETVFQPGDGHGDAKVFRVVYYGTFIPNHGTQYIMEGALRLRGEGAIRFELIGDGPDLAAAQAFAEQHGLTSVTFLGWMDQSELIERVRSAAVCLGAFGATPQSLMTVQNKIYECLASRKAVITGDSDVMRRQFRDRLHLYLVERGDGNAIAEAVRELYGDPELVKTLAEEGHQHFLSHFTLELLGREYRDILCEIAGIEVQREALDAL